MNETSLEFSTSLLIGLARTLSRWPRPAMCLLSGMIGRLVYVLVRRRRRIALTNLAIAFPDQSEAEREAIAKRHFKAFVISLIDRFALWEGPIKQLQHMVRVSGWSHLEEARDAGPLIVLAPHFLGLEAGGVRIQLERQIVSLYSDQSSGRLNDWILQGRSRFNEPILISRREGIGRLARLVKKGKTAYFLPDMDFGERDAVFAPFFGQPAATVTSVVRLAQMTGAHILPLVTRLTPSGYEARFYPAWRHEPGEALAAGVARMNQFIEQRVLESPAQYLWTHRRFKTRPEGLAPVFDRR